MKKLLSMALAMVLLFATMASMGVMASDTVIMSYGFEAAENEALMEQNKGWTSLFTGLEAGKATILDSSTTNIETEPVKPVSGTGYLKLENTEAFNNKDQKYITAFPKAMPALEAKTQYKFSFYWHGGGTLQYPAIKLSGPVVMNGYKRDNFIFVNSIKDAWVKFEVYFVTDDTLAEEQKLGISLYTHSGTDYYDELKLEKVEGASIRFISGTPSLTKDNTLTNTVQANTTRYGNFKPKNTYSIGTEKPYIWPVASSGIEAKSCTGNEDINIVSHYIPKAVGEKTALIAAIYKDINGVPSLQSVKVNDTCEYPVTPIAETTAMPEPHNRMDLGFDTLIVNAEELDAGCYIECFMWSSISGMKSLSNVATLPAAPVAATPAT